MREKILSLLAQNNGSFVSGETISKALGVTRAAVWKHMQALQNEGLLIEALPRKGYRLLAEKNQAPRSALLEPLLRTKWLGREANFVKEIDSTNLAAKRLASQGCANGAIFVAEEQTIGRGRRGRPWVNAPGEDICLSVVIRPSIQTQFAPRYTLAASLGIHRLASAFGCNPTIKWPNDVLINNKKLCGILLEMEGSIESLEWIVAGFGININNTSFDDKIASTATSLALETGAMLDRTQTLAKLLNLLEPLFESCEDEAQFSGLLTQYRQNCGTLGQQVTVTGLNTSLSGLALDVDETGRLIIQTADGKTHAVSAGDVTLRKPEK
ncbi:biotin--[acetyl-CoA-carboxylase] ligase [Eubacteriales bacterium OttesenSCG-928-K08]|nr:biotin--[acetyl-CoA-carboxylase] ligase [Eubacteriales bacterium OttesenSCG-928-K08]